MHIPTEIHVAPNGLIDVENFAKLFGKHKKTARKIIKEDARFTEIRIGRNIHTKFEECRRVFEGNGPVSSVEKA